MEYLKGILFIDIETVPIEPEHALLSERMQAEWAKKARLIKNVPDTVSDPATLFEERAGIYSEFAKVVCIGIGGLYEQSGKWKMRLRSLEHVNEQTLLHEFCEIISKFAKSYKDIRFCGHNIKEFDIPFLCRRMIINGVGLPDCMQLSGKKPWEITHIDTMEMWKYGDNKNFTSLSLLAEVLGIPSPKNDIDGSMVSGVFYKEKDLPRIGRYCLQDVLTSARVYLRLKGLNHIDPEPEFAVE